MSLLVIPNTFVNGSGPANIADATQVNANFTAVATAVNNIYPSQILPITSAQATFGATATGVSFKFLANDATAVGLIVSGVSGQSAALQQWTTTSGGTVALSVDKVGALVFGANGGAIGSASSVALFNDGQAVNGLIINLPTSSTQGLRILTNDSTTITQIAANGFFSAINAISAGTTGATGLLSAGDISGSRSVSTGVLRLGGSTASVGIDFNITNAISTTFFTAASAYTDIYAGTYHTVSDASLKTNIAPITGALAKIVALNPITFDVIASGKPGAGFTAQDIQAQFPEAVTADLYGTLAYAPTVVLAHLVQAFQEYVTAHP